MTNEQYLKLAAIYGFAPSRSLRELLDAATAQARLDEREACAALVKRNANACASNSILRDVLESNAVAIRARGNT